MPFVRTFAPIVAGAVGMDYRRFVFFNLVGGVAWAIGGTPGAQTHAGGVSGKASVT
jgi:membrane protein DedA with SNARE-associated domain